WLLRSRPCRRTTWASSTLGATAGSPDTWGSRWSPPRGGCCRPGSTCSRITWRPTATCTPR
ncbi:MAG: hypothetical protein AVDCRST_MAG50-1060, partial [uncultured Acidimicrobiales bacterium]